MTSTKAKFYSGGFTEQLSYETKYFFLGWGGYGALSLCVENYGFFDNSFVPRASTACITDSLLRED